MFAPTRYLEWARRNHGAARFDLASSGVRPVSAAELAFDGAWDAGDFDRLHAGIARYNDVPPAEAIAALGTTHALWLAYASLTSPGDEVLVETPGYEPLTRIAEGLGLRVATFERPVVERFALDPARVERAMTDRTRVVVVTNLHNPGGVRASAETLRAVAAVAGARGATLLVDEVYAPFDDLTDATGVFPHTSRKLAPNVVAVSSLTKCYGLGPHRVGWVLGPPAVVARANDAIMASAGMLPIQHASLGAHAFCRVPELAQRARAGLAARRARVAEWVQAQGLTYSAPQEGLFGFVSVPGAGDLTLALEGAARQSGVLVAPGAFFGVPGGFRVAWACSAEALEEGLQRLAPVVGRPGAGPGPEA